MSRHDKDLERHFESGKRLSIDMGTEVLMQINGVSGRLLSAQQFHGAVSTGISFDELDDASSALLKSHMTEWM